MPQLLEDLRAADDPRFVRRIIGQIVDADGGFKRGQNDHRFRGIENGWIRYISRGVTAYRLIYIQKGEDIYLYRAGGHSVEDNLSAPSRIEVSASIRSTDFNQLEVAGGSAISSDFGEFLKTSSPQYLSTYLHALFHVGHKEIVLISPFLTEGLLEVHSHLGRFLNKMVEEGANVFLVTRPVEAARLPTFARLEERGILVFFNESLHSKLYVFEINRDTLSYYNREMHEAAIIGSANLTTAGTGLEGEATNEELCFRLPDSKFEEARQYSMWLMNHSEDFVKYRNKSTRRF